GRHPEKGSLHIDAQDFAWAFLWPLPKGCSCPILDRMDDRVPCRSLNEGQSKGQFQLFPLIIQAFYYKKCKNYWCPLGIHLEFQIVHNIYFKRTGPLGYFWTMRTVMAWFPKKIA